MTIEEEARAAYEDLRRPFPSYSHPPLWRELLDEALRSTWTERVWFTAALVLGVTFVVLLLVQR